MFNKISIGIMTQHAKKEHLEVIWTSLLNQKLTQEIEIVLFSEEDFIPPYPEELKKRFLIKLHFYQKPFNIGAVRNSIVHAAQGKYLIYLDDDVAVGPMYLQTLISTLETEKPAVLAGLTYQVFRKPREFIDLFRKMGWEELIALLGRRDCYSRRIGRYTSETLLCSELGEANWLGAIGRNMTLERELALQFPFVEFKTMGFQDLEFAYRLQQLGKKIMLKNHPALACLHIFHNQKPSKSEDYSQSFQALVDQGKLPATSRKWFFQE